MEAFTVAQVVFSSVPVRGGTRWYFVEVSDPDGYTGVAEFTFGERSMQTARAIAQMADEIRGEPVEDEAALPQTLGLSPSLLQGDRILAAAVSALRSAVLDGLSQRAGLTLCQFLGGPGPRQVEPIELYANINRSLLPDDSGPVDRSPEAFAEIAALAVEDGFQTVKCAPFDECRAPFEAAGLPPETERGLERVAAVREAIGPEIALLVDCHSRFDLESALALEPELRKMDVEWFEEPVSYRADREALATITMASSIPVAAAEDGYGCDLFGSLIRDGVADVVMPDVKFCGGAGEAALTGRLLEAEMPCSVSLHSPSGPISLLASAHATAAFGNAKTDGPRPLEHAIGEIDWRATALEPPEQVQDGRLHLPAGPGLGASLNNALISEIGRRWTI